MYTEARDNYRVPPPRGNEHGKKTGRAKRLTRAARKEGGERGEEENIALRTGKKKAR